jgi:hypothetical protein
MRVARCGPPAAGRRSVTMTVDGTATKIVPGNTYTGAVVLGVA